MPLWTKEREAVVWNFEGKAGNLEVDRKKKHVINACWATQKQGYTGGSSTTRFARFGGGGVYHF